ncbi:MAG TPA: Holliday junction resolvase RuvX [Candidatus Baltobacteraceae bacterium]|jgi:putative Holliday junction resolvase
MSVLALDVGSKRIGVAVADPTESYALPLAVIERANLRDDLAEIVRIASEYLATELVVGDPVRLSGERGPAAEKMDRFVDQLQRVFSGTIHRVDERLTTAQVTKSLIAADVSRTKRKTVVDKMAAALILESFLARRRRDTSA